MKKLYLLLISLLLINCGGSDSDDSAIQETTSQKFLEKYNNKAFELNMASVDFTDYVTFYNNPNGLFFKEAQDELPYGYSCFEYIVGENNIDGEVVEVTITKHDSSSILFTVTKNSVTFLDVEVYEVKASNTNLQYLNITWTEGEGGTYNYAYSEVTGIDINTLCN